MNRLLLVALATLATAPLAAQTAVRDSVKLTQKVYYGEFEYGRGYDFYGREYYRFGCLAGVYATWPDVLADLGLRGGYYSYTLVVDGAPGARVPGSGMAGSDIGRPVPEGYLGQNAIGTWDEGQPVYPPDAPNRARCIEGRARATAILPQLPDWYAVYTIPDGTPVALYNWEQTADLDVAFDASFESRLSHEADATQPSGKRPVASYAWDFDDGQTSSGARPTHTFARADTFTVTLTVTDDDGETNSHSEKIIVGAALLSVRVESWETPVTVGERVKLEATITNTGNQDAEYIEVDRFFSHIISFPDSVVANDKGDPVLTRVETVDPDLATRDRLSPGESMAVRIQYTVDAAGTYRPSGGSDYVQIETEVRSSLLSVRARTADGAPVKVVDACEDGGCNDVTVIEPKSSVRLEFRTDGAVTTQVKAGLEYHAPESPLLYQVLGKSAVSPFSYTGAVDSNTGLVSDLEQHCHSACADIVVTVTDPATDQPLQGAKVVLSAPLVQGDAVVTSEHSGGHFCGDGSCANPLEIEADENGEARAYYSFPGIITAQDVDITAEVSAEGLDEDATETLRLLPNQRTDFVQEITLTLDETDFLGAAWLGRNGGAFYNIAGEACEGFGKWVLGGASDFVVRPGTSYVLHGGANVFTEWVCALDPFAALSSATGGNTKKVAETSMIVWFGERFQVPEGGLGTLNGPFPPPFVFYYDGDYYSAVLDVTDELRRASVGATVTLELFEVSWLREGGLMGNPLVPNVYFKLTRGNGPALTTLIEAGYLPETWLTPPPSEILARIAQANADRIYVQETLDRIREGDFVFIDPGTPFEEFSEIRLSSTSGRTSTGGTGADVELLLSRPLRFEHGADAQVLLLRGDSLVAPPSPPIVAGHDSTGTAWPLVLRWGMGRLETPASYRIEVAHDSLFADLLVGAEVVAEGTNAMPAQRYVYGDVVDGDVVFWRVRGSNLIGDGPWSRTGRVEAVDGYVTAGEDGPDDEQARPAAPVLSVYPNPAHGAASVALTLDVPGSASVAVYDLLGREVTRLHDGSLASGMHPFAVEAASLPAGVYVVRAVTEAGVVTTQLTVAR